MKYKNLFFIPARSGSKGLKNKNLKKINGKTLLELAIQGAKNFGLKNSYVYVSTDSKKYVKICKKNNIAIPFLRSKKNSKGNSNIINGIIEFLLKSKDQYENIIMLQTTTPLREINLFKKKINYLERKKFNSLISVKNLFRDKEFIFKKFSNNKLDIKKPIVLNPNRQLNKIFTPCGSFYATKTKLLLKNKSLFNPPVMGIETDFPKNIDIDTKLDLDLIKFFQ
jgi:CMP-N,N'-diacetyllegionaminic acid synthase